jgi:CBS domain-containing protein
VTNGFQPLEPAYLTKMIGTSLPAGEFLALFGVRVRNHDNVARIGANLVEAAVATVPSFATCGGGAILHFIEASEVPACDADDEEELPTTALPHRALQVGDLPSARSGVMSVSPGTKLGIATLLMRENNYSQVPVIDGISTLRGVLTWSSIARIFENGMQPTLENAMITDTMSVAETHNQLLAYLPNVATYGYLLVRANDGMFCGIITAADLGVQYEIMARPFFLVGDIEARLRKCLAILDSSAIAAVQKYKKTGQITDLTFGEYRFLLDNDDNWTKVGWSVPRDQIINRLETVRKIRNEIAHFRPEPLSGSNLKTLEDFASLLRQYVP